METQFKVEGIILNTKPWFEADKRVEIFSKKTGKMILLAKHACRSQKFSGRYETFNYIHANIYKGKSFLYVTQCDILQSFSYIRNHLNQLSLAAYCCSVIRKATSYGQGNPPLFSLLLHTLELLNNPDSVIQDIKSHFHTHFLKREGLLDHNIPVSDDVFKTHYEVYTGQTVPSLLFMQ